MPSLFSSGATRKMASFGSAAILNAQTNVSAERYEMTEGKPPDFRRGLFV